MVFAWPDFDFGGSTEVASIRSCQELSTDTVPDGSKDGSKAGPIRNGSNASVIAYLRRNQSKGFGAVLIPVREEQGKNL